MGKDRPHPKDVPSNSLADAFEKTGEGKKWAEEFEKRQINTQEGAVTNDANPKSQSPTAGNQGRGRF